MLLRSPRRRPENSDDIDDVYSSIVTGMLVVVPAIVITRLLCTEYGYVLGMQSSSCLLLIS